MILSCNVKHTEIGREEEREVERDREVERKRERQRKRKEL